MSDPKNGLGQRVAAAVRSTLFGVAPLAALLAIPAGLVAGGTWLWPQALALVGVHGTISLAGNVSLAVWRPAHFQVRQQSVVAAPAKKQPLLDAVGAAALAGFGFAWLVFVPLDVFRLHLLPRPSSWVSWTGGAAAALGTALTPIAVWENRFATPNVQDQTGAGQRIIDTGVYGFIRHPIYLGNLLLFGGAALWLGSWAAFCGLAVLAVATVGRIVIEENDLRARIPAYRDYERRVRGRLIPFVL